MYKYVLFQVTRRGCGTLRERERERERGMMCRRENIESRPSTVRTQAYVMMTLFSNRFTP